MTQEAIKSVDTSIHIWEVAIFLSLSCELHVAMYAVEMIVEVLFSGP